MPVIGSSTGRTASCHDAWRARSGSPMKPRAHELLLARERREDLLRVGPEANERIGEAIANVGRRIGEAPEPRVDVQPVVRLLAPHLRRQLRERRPAARAPAR